MYQLESQLTYPKRRLIFIVIFLLQFALQVSPLTKGTEYIASMLTFDDTYYYLLTAWNFKLSGIPTFDGLHPTNGVQLLWFWIVALLALLSPTKVVLLISALSLCFLFNASCYLVIWKFAETIQQPRLAIYMASFWFLLTFGSEFYSTGMENSLHALIFWLLIWQTALFLREPDGAQKRSRLVYLTILLVLNVWTRLDGAIFSIILYFYCLSKLPRNKLGSYILVPSILAILGLIIQLASFYLMGGTFLPISSLVKRTWGGWEGISQLATLRLIFALILVLFLELLLHRYGVEQRKSWRGLWYCLLLSVFLHVLATGSINAYYLFLWYLSPSFIFLVITFAIFAEDFRQIASRLIPAAAKAIPIAVCLPLILVSSLFFSIRWNNHIPAYKIGYQASLWISEKLPPDARLASWNAGILGFFSGRPVINLDGLINGADYYQRVIKGPLSWEDYVREKEVDYVVDYDIGMVKSAEFPVARIFTLSGNENDEVVMWKVLPEVLQPQPTK